MLNNPFESEEVIKNRRSSILDEKMRQIDTRSKAWILAFQLRFGNADSRVDPATFLLYQIGLLKETDSAENPAVRAEWH